ncbi:MAG: response regulator transcription factor [Pseudonocardiaceae bacterium]
MQDRRRLVRDGLGGLLAAAQGIEVVATVALVAELHAITNPFDTLLLSADEEQPGNSFRILRFTDSDSATTLIAAVRGERPPARTDHPSLRDISASGPRLTPREVQIMQGIANGLASAQVAMSLGITRKSVENHKQRIFAKLGVQSQAHAVAVSIDAGLLGPVNVSHQDRTG